MADKDQKTEQPTQRRLHKAREEGNFPTARIFVNALQFVAFVALLHAWGGRWIGSIRAEMATLLDHALTPQMSARQTVAIGVRLLTHCLAPLAVLGGTLVAITIAVQ